MTIGDAKHGLSEVLDWAQDLNVAVVSVDFRLARRRPTSGPVEDCCAVRRVWPKTLTPAPTRNSLRRQWVTTATKEVDARRCSGGFGRRHISSGASGAPCGSEPFAPSHGMHHGVREPHLKAAPPPGFPAGMPECAPL